MASILIALKVLTPSSNV